MAGHSTYTTEACFHFPPTYRMAKQIPLNSQSTPIATQIPNTPISRYTPNTTLHPIRNTHMETAERINVNFTSAAALRVLGRKKDGGQMVTTHPQ